MDPNPDRMVGPLDEATRGLVTIALRQAAMDLTSAALAMAAGTEFAPDPDIADALRAQGAKDSLTGIEIANAVSMAVRLCMEASAFIAINAIFDGSMPEDEREEFFPGEFFVGPDGEVRYQFADTVRL